MIPIALITEFALEADSAQPSHDLAG